MRRSYVATEWGKPLELREDEVPVPMGREVLVRITAAGVCHSDLHIHDGYYDLGSGKRLTNADRGLTTPRTLGHEIAGTIEALGPEASGVSVGDDVVVYPWIGCGQCDACALGDEQNCPTPRTLGIFFDGGYSTHCLVPDPKYCVPLDGIAPEVAALYACSGITTFHALRKFDEATFHQEPVLIIGAGGLGMMALTILNGMGGYGAIMADVDERKREAAMANGARAVVNPRDPDVVAQIKALAPSGRGLRMAIDLVGNPDTLQLAVDSLVKGGKVVSVGLMGGEFTIPTPYLPMRALTIEGSYVGTLQELRDLMALVREKNIPPPPIETHSLDEARQVMDALRAGKITGRGVLVP